jgi:hypothetical protein
VRRIQDLPSDHHHDDDLHDRGLAFDLSTLTGLLRRRRVLGLFAGAGAAATLAACGDGAGGTAGSPRHGGLDRLDRLERWRLARRHRLRR